MKREIVCGDALEVLRGLPDESVHCCVTSPPYWSLRDYGVEGQLGLEETMEEYVEKIVEVFREVRRVLRNDSTLWLNLGDSYASSGVQGPNSGLAKLADRHAPRVNPRNPNRDDIGDVPRAERHIPIGLKPKDLVGIPWRVAFALQADGWWLRSDIIWSKPNPMPESVRDRPTKAHEYIFLLSKSARYYYDADAIKEPTLDSSLERCESGFVTSTRDGAVEEASIGSNKRTRYGLREKFVAKTTRNKRTVWTVSTQPFKEAHFAVFPPGLIRPCVLAGCPPMGTVLDPFFGAGTTGLVAKQEGRGYIGIELNPVYAEMARERIRRECPMERLVVAS